MLAQTIADVRKRIAKSPKGLNENNTKATLIEPVLRALGWDVEDVDEVAREYKGKKQDKPVDYALLVMREPRLFVEAKALGESLDGGRYASQIMGYAAVAGVEWIVITNGDEYRIYNSHAAVRVEEKMLRSVRVSAQSDDAVEYLGLLSKDQLKTKRIDALWQAHFVDRQVKAALERFFSSDQDMPLVHHVRGIAPNLTPEDVRASMRRCKLVLDFPLSPGDVSSLVRPKGASGESDGALPHDERFATLVDVIKSGLVRAPLRITAKYKNKEFTARAMADGTVELDGTSYPSLSAAGSAALASAGGLTRDGDQRAVNGWDFWRYQSADGTTKPLAHARHEFVVAKQHRPPRGSTG